MVTGPELEQVEEDRVLHRHYRGEPTEFPDVLHEGEVPPDEGEEAGSELHCRRGGKTENKNFSKNGKQNEGKVAPTFSPSFLWVESSVTIHSGEQGNEEARNFFSLT